MYSKTKEGSIFYENSTPSANSQIKNMTSTNKKIILNRNSNIAKVLFIDKIQRQSNKIKNIHCFFQLKVKLISHLALQKGPTISIDGLQPVRPTLMYFM